MVWTSKNEETNQVVSELSKTKDANLQTSQTQKFSASNHGKPPGFMEGLGWFQCGLILVCMVWRFLANQKPNQQNLRVWLVLPGSKPRFPVGLLVVYVWFELGLWSLRVFVQPMCKPVETSPGSNQKKCEKPRKLVGFGSKSRFELEVWLVWKNLRIYETHCINTVFFFCPCFFCFCFFFPSIFFYRPKTWRPPHTHIRPTSVHA